MLPWERCCGAVEGFGKEHAHGLPLVLQPRAEPALTLLASPQDNEFTKQEQPCIKQLVVVVVVVGSFSERICFVREACVFGTSNKKKSFFIGKTVRPPNGVVGFLLETHIPKQIIEIVDYNNNIDKPWKSSGMLRVKPNIKEIPEDFAFSFFSFRRFSIFFVFYFFIFFFYPFFLPPLPFVFPSLFFHLFILFTPSFPFFSRPSRRESRKTKSRRGSNCTNKTPEGRSAIFRVKGLVVFF